MGILYACALYLVIKTRKIKIKGLNGAKYIAASVYSTSIILAMTIIASIVLTNYINAYATVYSFGFWLVNSLMLGLLFIPKVSMHAVIMHTILIESTTYHANQTACPESMKTRSSLNDLKFGARLPMF